MSAEKREAVLKLQDGTALRADLWCPARGGPWPTLLMRQPYGKSIASTVTLADPTWWAAQGYLVVIQDVRGQGDSEGTFGGFSQEAADTTETLSWVRALPESNGKLGCYGFSYQGLTQLLAIEGTPPPDCLAPAMAGVDERDHWSCEGGAHWWHLGLGWGLQLAALQAKRRNDHKAWDSIRRSLEDGSYLRDGPDLLKRHDPDGMAHRWFQNDPRHDPDWVIHAIPSTWLKQPMLLIGGWWDPHLRGILDLRQRSIDAGGHPQVHIGPASHLQWWPGAQQLLLTFFDRHLKDGTPPAEASTTECWNMTTGHWQTPGRAESIEWQMTGDSLACHDPDHGALTQGTTGSGTVRIVHDPWRPVPAIGGHLSPGPGAVDRQDIDARSDVATFTSEPLLQVLTLEGTPELTLEAHADQPGFDLCLALSRVSANGDRVEQLSTGHLRLRGPEARQPQQRSIRMQPLLASLQQGDRLRLSIAGASWPAIGVNSGSDTVPCGAPSCRHRVIAMTLQLAGSHLTLIPFSAGRLQHK